ncbi:uncharacterized protein H6S33_001402 [Morchella sextelata]|uniref:uncharacterized protein n=1 Tax=Morchella sextelata TaxID=1174677 RepID=UPI001D036A8B|nr:uncharacterized protein H6S33_001402 [Morchella sextelata]KAH0609174.1 hypothetical protein H6S33_001402 [Morchella sextelata]
MSDITKKSDVSGYAQLSHSASPVAKICDPATLTPRPLDPATSRPLDPATSQPLDLSTSRPLDPATSRPRYLSTPRHFDPATYDLATLRPCDL